MQILLLAALFLPQGYAELFARGHAQLEAGRPLAAQRDFEEALALRPENPNCAYALACAASSAGDLAHAAQWLKTATDWGYDDPAVAAWDPDLEALRKTEAWAKLLAPIEDRAHARPKEVPALRFDWRPDCMFATFSPDNSRLLLGRGGYGYLYGLAEHELIAVLSRAGEHTNSATFSADGRYILRCTDKEKYEIWDGVTGEFIRTLEGTGGWQGYLLPCGPSGRVVGYSWGPYGDVAAWDSTTGKLLRRLPIASPSSVAVSPDGKRALVAEEPIGSPTKVSFWDLESGSKLASHDDRGRPMFAAAFGPDGKLAFAMSHERGRVVVYDGRTGAELRTIEDATGQFRFARFLGHTGTLLVQTEAGAIQWIDPATGKVQRSVDIGKRAWGGMASDPSGKSILLTEGHEPYDGGSRLELLDAVTGESLWKRDCPHCIGWSDTAAFSEDGSLIVFGDWNQVEIADARTGRTVQQFRRPARGLSVLPIRDPHACILATEDGALACVDLGTGKAVATAELPGAPVRKLLASRDGARLLLLREDGQAAILDGEHLTLSYALATERGCQAAFSPDGEHVALWSREKGLALSDAKTGALERRIDSGLARIEDLDWSRDGRLLALADAEGAVQVIDAQTGAKIGEPIRRDKPAGDDRFPSTVVRFAPDAQSLAISVRDPLARICERASGKVLREFSHKDDDWDDSTAVGDLAFSPDGALLLSTTVSFGSVYGWNAKTGERLWRFDWGAGNPSPVYVRFDPTGARACTFGMGPWTPRIFDVKTGALQVELKDNGLSQLDFSGDGQRMVASTGDSLQVLRASDGALLFERIEIARGGALLRSGSMHVDGSPAALREVQVLIAGSSCPLESLAAVLLDPKRVRAAAAGVAVAPALVPDPPALEAPSVDGRKLVTSGSCPVGMLGFEVELDGQPLDLARVRTATKLEDDGRRARLELTLDGPGAGSASRVRVCAVARSGICSRPRFAALPPAKK